MRSKNSRPIDAEEAELSSLSACARSCGASRSLLRASASCEGMRVRLLRRTGAQRGAPQQGLHFCTVAACKRCHDVRVWRMGGMTEIERERIVRAVNCHAELVEALEELTQYMTSGNASFEFTPEYDRARAILAKATGDTL